MNEPLPVLREWFLDSSTLATGGLHPYTDQLRFTQQLHGQQHLVPSRTHFPLRSQSASETLGVLHGDEVILVRPDDGLEAGTNSQLRQHPSEMRFDRCHLDHQLVRDLTVSHSLRQ